MFKVFAPKKTPILAASTLHYYHFTSTSMHSAEVFGVSSTWFKHSTHVDACFFFGSSVNSTTKKSMTVHYDSHKDYSVVVGFTWFLFSQRCLLGSHTTNPFVVLFHLHLVFFFNFFLVQEPSILLLLLWKAWKNGTFSTSPEIFFCSTAVVITPGSYFSLMHLIFPRSHIPFKQIRFLYSKMSCEEGYLLLLLVFFIIFTGCENRLGRFWWNWFKICARVGIERKKTWIFYA